MEFGSKLVAMPEIPRNAQFSAGERGEGVTLRNVKKTPVKGAVAGGKTGGPAAGEITAEAHL